MYPTIRPPIFNVKIYFYMSQLNENRECYLILGPTCKIKRERE